MSGHRHDDDSRSELLCITCPLCSGPAAIPSPNLTPWFCVNDDCECLAWDPYATLAENLMDAHPISIIEMPPD